MTWIGRISYNGGTNSGELWPCVDEFSMVNATVTQLRDLITSTLWLNDTWRLWRVPCCQAGGSSRAYQKVPDRLATRENDGSDAGGDSRTFRNLFLRRKQGHIFSVQLTTTARIGNHTRSMPSLLKMMTMHIRAERWEHIPGRLFLWYYVSNRTYSVK